MLTAVPLTLGLLLVPISDGAAGYWDWQLTHPYDLSINVSVLALDGEEHDAETIAALKQRGVKTVCYISVGTWEEWRDDADRFPQSVRGNSLGDWPGERYVDVRQTDILFPIMVDRIEACKKLGYDAIEPDNMDGFENESGFDLTEEDVLTYVLQLAEYAHVLGMEIAQKNAPTLTDRLAGTMDFLMVEDCFRWDFCWDVKIYAEMGKDVLATEYTDSDLDWDATCQEARDYGFHLLLKNREITAGGKVCTWD